MCDARRASKRWQRVEGRLRHRVALLGMFASALWLALAPVAGAQPVATFELRPGVPLFFDGPKGFSESVFASSAAREAICQAGGPGCLDYRLVLPHTAERLRVALDYGRNLDLARGTLLSVYLIDPQGQEVAQATGD